VELIISNVFCYTDLCLDQKQKLERQKVDLMSSLEHPLQVHILTILLLEHSVFALSNSYVQLGRILLTCMLGCHTFVFSILFRWTCDVLLLLYIALNTNLIQLQLVVPL